MSIFIDNDTRLVVQGITGRDGSFHTKQMIEYGTKVVAGVIDRLSSAAIAVTGAVLLLPAAEGELVSGLRLEVLLAFGLGAGGLLTMAV